ncbi:MAG: hypothetical protein IIU76_02375 [Bacteroidales bacterium]|nr:hypothetical protein [Bacteroidales bacterium]
MEELPLNLRGLRYKSFSLVYMHSFGVATKGLDKVVINNPHIKLFDNLVDSQIFEIDPQLGSPVKRYILPDFDFSTVLEEPYEVSIQGKIYVALDLFLGQTAMLSFKMVVNNDACRASESITTDHLIALAALNLGAEHWNVGEERTCSNINLTTSPVDIKNLRVTADGIFTEKGYNLSENKEWSNSFDVVCGLYKKAVLNMLDTVAYPSKNFVYVDIWEDVDNYDGSLQAMEKEEDIIKYISDNCKKELVGLMSLYPSEWPYRTEEAFDDVCGFNIAIDTDDLVLVNSSMCVVFGTYARRGKDSPTDWAEMMKDRSVQHVSWFEYLLILQMILAKKYALSIAKRYVIKESNYNNSNVNITRAQMQRNTQLEMEITNLLMNLDAVDYSKFISHKIMFDRTTKRLDIDKDLSDLQQVLKRTENALKNVSTLQELEQSQNMNIILFVVSVASLAQIIMSEPKVPLLEKFNLGWLAGGLGHTIVSLTILLAIVAIGYLIYNFIKDLKNK